MISWRLEIIFCIFLPMILGIRALFGPSFPKVSWCPKYPKTGETLPSTGFCTWVMLQLMWNLAFNTFFECLYIQVHDLGFLGLALLRCPKYTKTGMNKPSDGLYIWVRFHMIWNMEFNILDNFLWIGVHDLGYLGWVCPSWSNSPNILKRFNSTLRWSLPLSKASFDVKCRV